MTDFADSGPEDPHYVLDERAGQVMLGPAVRQPDGSMAQYGAIPPKEAVLRISSYRTGGGRRGNVSKGALSVLKSTIPYVSTVENRQPASGGVDGETIEEAKIRGPIVMRTLNRGVTAVDYEHLTREASPEVARVRCVPAGRIGDPSDGAGGSPGPDRAEPAWATNPGGCASSSSSLRRRPSSGSPATSMSAGWSGRGCVVEPPDLSGCHGRRPGQGPGPGEEVDGRGGRRSGAVPSTTTPIIGGPDGTGWPFGRPIHVGEVYAVLQRIEGVEYIEQARLYGTDPITGRRGEAVDRLEIDPNSLVFSYEHLIRVGGL